MEKAMVLVLFIINVCACLPEGHPPVEVSPDVIEEVDQNNDGADLTDIQQVDSVNTDVSVDAIDQNDVTDDGSFDAAQDDIVDADEHDGEDVLHGDIDNYDAISHDTPPVKETFINTDTLTGVDTPINVDVQVSVDTPIGVDTPVVVGVDVDGDEGKVGVDTIDCSPGYSYDPAEGKCVSFCAADKYFETNLGKCVYYPCCDLTGSWEVSVLDPDTMDFTIYSIYLNQNVSYLSGDLTLYSPLEISECYGTLEKDSFALNCSNVKYKLIFTSGIATDTDISGFYSLDSKDNGVKNGAFNMTNTM
jgi:hypothetical protein